MAILTGLRYNNNIAKEVSDMDIAGLSSALANVRVQNQVGTAVLSQAMDTNEALGEGLVKMIDSAAMENSVTPWVGSNFDMKL